MTEQYGEDYYLRGVEKGLSNYQNFRWLESQTMALAERLIEVIGITMGDHVLDWGAARGFLVKALRRLGVHAWGYDISEWAVENCDPEVKGFVSTKLQFNSALGYDHVILKDVGEHFTVPDLIRATDWLLGDTRKSILFIVPLTEIVGGQYVRREDDMDVTHVIRWPLHEWMSFFQRRIPGEEWTLQGSWHIPGLKPTSLSHPKSCGFITLRRI